MSFPKKQSLAQISLLVKNLKTTILNPQFSPSFYCGGGPGHVGRARLAKRRIHTHLRRLATKPCEKCGLSLS